MMFIRLIMIKSMTSSYFKKIFIRLLIILLIATSAFIVKEGVQTNINNKLKELNFFETNKPHLTDNFYKSSNFIAFKSINESVDYYKIMISLFFYGKTSIVERGDIHKVFITKKLSNDSFINHLKENKDKIGFINVKYFDIKTNLIIYEDLEISLDDDTLNEYLSKDFIIYYIFYKSGRVPQIKQIEDQKIKTSIYHEEKYSILFYHIFLYILFAFIYRYLIKSASKIKIYEIKIFITLMATVFSLKLINEFSIPFSYYIISYKVYVSLILASFFSIYNKIADLIIAGSLLALFILFILSYYIPINVFSILIDDIFTIIFLSYFGLKLINRDYKLRRILSKFLKV